MAVEDLTAIWNYTEEKWSEQQADSYYEQLIAASRRIADEPFLPGSKKYDHIEAGLCGFKIHKHIDTAIFTEISQLFKVFCAAQCPGNSKSSAGLSDIDSRFSEAGNSFL